MDITIIFCLCMYLFFGKSKANEPFWCVSQSFQTLNVIYTQTTSIMFNLSNPLLHEEQQHIVWNNSGQVVFLNASSESWTNISDESQRYTLTLISKTIVHATIANTERSDAGRHVFDIREKNQPRCTEHVVQLNVDSPCPPFLSRERNDVTFNCSFYRIMNSKEVEGNKRSIAFTCDTHHEVESCRLFNWWYSFDGRVAPIQHGDRIPTVKGSSRRSVKVLCGCRENQSQEVAVYGIGDIELQDHWDYVSLQFDSGCREPYGTDTYPTGLCRNITILSPRIASIPIGSETATRPGLLPVSRDGTIRSDILTAVGAVSSVAIVFLIGTFVKRRWCAMRTSGHHHVCSSVDLAIGQDLRPGIQGVIERSEIIQMQPAPSQCPSCNHAIPCIQSEVNSGKIPRTVAPGDDGPCALSSLSTYPPTARPEPPQRPGGIGRHHRDQTIKPSGQDEEDLDKLYAKPDQTRKRLPQNTPATKSKISAQVHDVMTGASTGSVVTSSCDDAGTSTRNESGPDRSDREEACNDRCQQVPLHQGTDSLDGYHTIPMDFSGITLSKNMIKGNIHAEEDDGVYETLE